MTMTSKAMRQGGASAAYADLIPQWVRQRAKDFFSYGFEVLALAANATTSKLIAIQNDADYLIVGVNASLWNAGAVTKPTTNPVRFNIVDTGAGRQLMNTWVMFDDLVGTGQLPGYWPYPKLIARASTIQVDTNNLAPATTYDLRFSFMGFKIFDRLEDDGSGN